MFGISTFELLVIAAIALVVIGPEKFPEFAKSVMRIFTDIRGYVNDVKRDVEKEMRPVTKELKQLSRYNPEQYINKIGEEMSIEGKAGASSTTKTPADSKPASETATDDSSAAPAGTQPAGTHPADVDEYGYNPEPDGPSEVPDDPVPVNPSDEDSNQEYIHPYERLEKEYEGSSPDKLDR